MAFQVILRGFGGTPVGSHRGEFTYDQRFNKRSLGFLIVDIGADVTDVWISKADNLARIAGIAEDFLIAGETRIKNDFAAAARAGAGSTPVKGSSVLERENGRA